MRRITAGRTVRALAAIGLLTGLGAAAAAPAQAGGLVDFDLRLHEQRPGLPTGFDVHVLVHTEGDADEKSSPITGAVLAGPRGLRFDSAAAPRCDASDEELRVMGVLACPRESRVGFGSYSAMTGFGAPVDPFWGDNHVFNADGQLIEVIAVPGTPVAPGFDRLTIEGNTLTAHPPAVPGGPPDDRTATRSIDFTVPRHGALVMSPPRCPRSRFWRSRATFTFLDGRTETVTSLSPCRRARRSGPRRSGRSRR